MPRRFKIKKKHVLVGGVVAALIATGLVAGNKANADPVTHATTQHSAIANIGPGWTEVQWKAYSGGGCAIPNSNSRLAPIISWPCNSYIWFYRVIGSGSNYQDIELVDQTGTYAVGFSGGQFKLETPDISSTYLIFYEQSGYCLDSNTWCNATNNTFTGVAAPNGKGLDLNVSSNVVAPTYDWSFPVA